VTLPGPGGRSGCGAVAGASTAICLRGRGGNRWPYGPPGDRGV